MFLIRNEVYNNINYIPYYNEHYDDPAYLAQHQMSIPRPNYGSSKV